MTQYNVIPYRSDYVPNWAYVNNANNIGGKAMNMAGLFSRLRNSFGAGKTIGPNLGIDLSNLTGLSSDIQNTNLMGLGKIGNLANAGMGIYQGAKGISNLNALSGANSDLGDMKSDVQISAMSNPLAMSYLNADQKALLRKVQNDTYGKGSQLGAGLESSAKSIPKALLSALGGFVVGGAPGAIINGVGTLANAGLEGASAKAQENTSKLQGLYDSLSAAENEYNSMRRTGLQRKYSSGLY